MKDSIYDQEIAEDEAYFRDAGALKPAVDLPVTQPLPLHSPVVELWDGEVVRRDTAITYLSELNSQQVDK